MKRKVLAIGLLALTACGGTTTEKIVYMPATDAPTTTVRVVKTTDAPIAAYSDDDVFLSSVRDLYGSYIGVPDQDVIDAGRGTCETLRAGATAQDVADSANESADGDYDIYNLLSSVIASAVVTYCPDQQYKFSN